MNEEEQGNEEAAAVEPELLPPSRKRVRISDPDLKIICKGEQDDKKAFMCHSVVMATHSGYFDALLSTGMRESAEKKVVLDDVSPEVFEKAMSLVEDPLTPHDLGAEDALVVASFYNRFDFTGGMKLVTSVLGKILDHWAKTTSRAPLRQEKDLLIETILFAEESSSPELIQECIKFLTVKFCQKDACGMGLFEVEDIKKLHHFLVHEGRECVEEFYDEFTGFDDDGVDQLIDDSKLPKDSGLFLSGTP